MLGADLIHQQRQVIKVAGDGGLQGNDAVVEGHAADGGGVGGEGDHGDVEAVFGNVAGGAAGLGPDDDEFGVDIFDDGLGAVGDGGGSVMNHLQQFGGQGGGAFAQDVA